MKEVVHEEDGRKYMVALPDHETDTSLGIILGPPDFVDQLEIPEPFATRLHNQMFSRKLFSLRDLRKRPKEVTAALQSAMRVDAAAIINAYNEAEKETFPAE